ncbi:MAG: hypothetical protein HQ538_04645 [Parcubacteria group bacterium]|nr:hypothetical protein [Parcubacteria group bacterium]
MKKIIKFIKKSTKPYIPHTLLCIGLAPIIFWVYSTLGKNYTQDLFFTVLIASIVGVMLLFLKTLLGTSKKYSSWVDTYYNLVMYFFCIISIVVFSVVTHNINQNIKLINNNYIENNSTKNIINTNKDIEDIETDIESIKIILQKIVDYHNINGK